MRGRRIFVIASFSGVAGALAAAGGCGVTSTTLTEFIEGGPPPPPLPPPAPVRPPPPATDTTPPPSPPPPFDDGGDEASTGACPVTSPIDASTLAYQPPVAPMGGACTDADLNALDTNLPSSATDDPVKPLLSASCAACVFTDGTKATWGPLPEKTLPDGGHVVLTVDVGGCYAAMTHSDACGKTTQNLYDCRFAACAGCPSGDATAYLACVKKATATGGVCDAEVKAYQTACNAVDAAIYKAAQDACEPPPPVKYVFDGPVRVMCIAQPDGGDGG